MRRRLLIHLAAPALAFALTAAAAVPAYAVVAPKPFDTPSAMVHVRRLAAIGPRVEGTSRERAAADYAAARLRAYGYVVRVQNVPLPNGRISHNVIAERRGTSADVVLLGAHLDSKAGSPGANDDGSGCATVLELARDFAGADSLPTIRFVLFGAEEMIGRDPSKHHFGSRAYVRSLTSAQRARIHAMVSVDMVGYGTVFNVGNMRRGPMTCVRSLQQHGISINRPLTFKLDTGRWGWSDHEPFELAGIPAAWLSWRVDPVYHTPGDTAAHIRPVRIQQTGQLLRTWVNRMDAEDLDALR